jgi:hypothetical protein
MVPSLVNPTHLGATEYLQNLVEVLDWLSVPWPLFFSGARYSVVGLERQIELSLLHTP